MASVKKMNEIIATHLYGDNQQQPQNFHEDYNLLMQAIQKSMGEGKEVDYTDTNNQLLWFAILPERTILNKREGIRNWKTTIDGYSCAFSKLGFSKVGYGEKFNHEFKQSSPIRAIHYSLYRLIRNGLEY